MVQQKETTGGQVAGIPVQEIERKRSRQLLETTAKALIKHGFKALVVDTAREAQEKALEMIPTDAHVGFGGSVTMRQIGLVDALAARGNRLADHWKPGLSREQQMAIRRDQLNCDVFLASANAVTMEGELINIDGGGNRVAALAFGPRRVIVIAGVNKLAKDVAEGIHRARNVAASLNAARLSAETPCAHTGLCNDCNSPARICRITTITERCPHGADYTVILVNEESGF